MIHTESVLALLMLAMRQKPKRRWRPREFHLEGYTHRTVTKVLQFGHKIGLLKRMIRKDLKLYSGRRPHSYSLSVAGTRFLDTLFKNHDRTFYSLKHVKSLKETKGVTP